MPKSILIADDHPLILKGLNDFLIEKKYNVIAKAKNGKEAYTLIKAHQPEIAILDIQMPYLTGLEVALKIQEEAIETKVVIVTFEKCEKIFNQAKSLDSIYGYILKEFALDEIENCLKRITEGRIYFSPDLAEFLEIKETPEALKTLTTTEMKVIRYIAKNKTGVMMADLMHISPRTVEKHKSNIIKKLDIGHKQNSLLIWAKENEEFIL